MEYKEASNIVLSELENTFNVISEDDIEKLIQAVFQADKVFFVGVGRVKLSLEAIAKRWAHLGISTFVVGQITEPAITDSDLLIVGSGSGESLYPLQIAKKAKEFGAKVLHIGSNAESSMKLYSDFFVRIPVQSKLYLEDEISSKQPMTSLFEQSLLLLGDVVSLMIVDRKQIVIDNLWQYHANLE
ncbi:6-phospho-3-hexuloisomerase [Aerococcus loyolae]|uniref:SIS domain-containing protein n=1 Tax=Aerococcus loyolae TaxID=2976809 RepID=A0ABT4BYA8_9LACT|nr:6-phospho-3-hexuloisomerase [Aerococcus loyolae]MCY3025257.1 SIS domain-containing protein [Aerococcus loyolae]MCY3027046.1 SIS domain-containing protein [Aerococcus loyolae]MCY3028629.1 SIS domain-containing protein [Aerococcus loyolae]OAM70607.1 sugar isomerase [Aerococcus loyolae]